MNKQREQWRSRFGFILASAGSAVGLGNIWKFPFEAGNNGGAAFVLIYLCFCFILGLPVMAAEIAIGRKSGKNPVGAFKTLGFKNWTSIGWLGIFISMMTLSFYNIVAAWAFGYFFELISGNFAIGSQFSIFVKDWFKVGVYAVIFMGSTAFIVSRGVTAGIERAARILMPALLGIMILLVVYSFTLANAQKGVEFYLMPDFSKIDLKVIYSALGQAFFSLSLGAGIFITLGSYLSEKENIVKSAMFITIADVGIALLAGLMMFPLVFSQGLAPNGGPGLIFATLPGVFESLGAVLGIVVGSLFFLLLSFAGLTSTVTMLEVPVSYAVDEFKMSRNAAVLSIAVIVFIIGIPSLLAHGASEYWTKFIFLPGSGTIDFMTAVIFLVADTLLPLGGFLIAIFVLYAWKKENLHKHLALGNSGYERSWVRFYIDFTLSYVAPVCLAVVFILMVLDRFVGIKLF